MSFPLRSEDVAQQRENGARPAMAGSSSTLSVGPARAFSDGDGAYWIVREFEGDSVVANGGGPCLIFSSDTVFRRVRTFPSNWRELGPDELLVLSWKH